MLIATDFTGEQHAKLDALTEHFGGFISHEALIQAFEYAERFPQDIAQRLRNNARVEQLLQKPTRR